MKVACNRDGCGNFYEHPVDINDKETAKDWIIAGTIAHSGGGFRSLGTDCFCSIECMMVVKLDQVYDEISFLSVVKRAEVPREVRKTLEELKKLRQAYLIS